MTTGTSVLGVVYKDGVLLACDTLASYGSLAYWQKVSRIAEVAEGTALAASGEFSDFQEAQEIIGNLARKDRCIADGHPHSTREIWSYMSRIMYQKRNKMNPLYNSFLIAGMVPDPDSLSCAHNVCKEPRKNTPTNARTHKQMRGRRSRSWGSWTCLARRSRRRSLRLATGCTLRCR